VYGKDKRKTYNSKDQIETDENCLVKFVEKRCLAWDITENLAKAEKRISTLSQGGEE
jgi:hypothetical protein